MTVLILLGVYGTFIAVVLGYYMLRAFVKTQLQEFATRMLAEGCPMLNEAERVKELKNELIETKQRVDDIDEASARQGQRIDGWDAKERRQFAENKDESVDLGMRYAGGRL